MMPLDPDTDSSRNTALEVDGAQVEVDGQLPQVGDGTNTDFAPIEPDVEEAAFIGDQRSAAESREIAFDGYAPPAGWRACRCGSRRR